MTFQNKWAKQTTPGLTEKVSDMLKHNGPLKPRVQAAIVRLQKQVTKLDGMLGKLAERDAKIFSRIVQATQQHDTHTSKVLSSELAEVRKVSKVLGNARIALEQIELRLSTAHDLGDTIVTIMPTIGLMKGMKSSLAKFMPGADQEIGKMAEMLGGMMTDTFTNDSSFATDTATTEESEKILQEAAAIAENTADSKFPTMPTDIDQSVETPNKFM
ncbi:MAG: Snf7 domain-containing protein [Cenarchaeum symbiont of Oopsacas minuta]|nr:Snf7 domain-containing protein [Cenarchaeum symbiont of Oopsacas minuta]